MTEMVDIIYPRRCPATGATCLLCPEPSRLLICLPAEAAQDEHDDFLQRLITALEPHAVVPAGTLNGDHFPLWHQPDQTETRLLLLSSPDPDCPHLGQCAGGPLGLLDLATTAYYLHDAAADLIQTWRAQVAGTPPARPWRHYLRAHRRDPHRYRLPEAITDFAAQPRITTMRQAPDPQYNGDLYGPGLEALDAGTDTYADYETGRLILGEGLIDLDGRLLAPARRALVEQPLDEVRGYHDRVRSYLQSLDPTVVVAAVSDIILTEC